VAVAAAAAAVAEQVAAPPRTTATAAMAMDTDGIRPNIQKNNEAADANQRHIYLEKVFYFIYTNELRMQGFKLI
jgi:hypothetical protein